MKNKYMLKMLIICAVALFAGSCEKNCEVKRPKDLKPIDWENYNDVYTVYWNYVYYGYNSPRKINEEDLGKDILICGFANNWDSRPPSATGFIIVDNAKKNLTAKEIFPCISVRPSFWNQDFLNQLQTILDTGYLANIKCYVKGKLSFENLTPDMTKCQDYEPVITINNVDDIYFKEEE
jgi:hypothetical protein